MAPSEPDTLLGKDSPDHLHAYKQQTLLVPLTEVLMNYMCTDYNQYKLSPPLQQAPTMTLCSGQQQLLLSQQHLAQSQPITVQQQLPGHVQPDQKQGQSQHAHFQQHQQQHAYHYGMMTPVVLASPPPPLPVSLTVQLEVVWHGEFERLFQQYLPDGWTLSPVEEAPQPQGWNLFKDSAKVRFNCTKCGHCWTSMKGRIVFWYQLSMVAGMRQGHVLFKLYGQQCNKCKASDFNHAMWYPEEVVKVIGNIYNRVGQMFYGFYSPPLRVDRRHGRPRDQHNSALCQACQDGVCTREWQFQ